MKPGDLVKYRIDEEYPCRLIKTCGVVLGFEVDNNYFTGFYEAVNSESAIYNVVHVIVMWGGDDLKKSWEFLHEIEVISESR